MFVFPFFFLRDKLSGLLQTCTIGLIRVILIVNCYGVGWKDYLRSHLLKQVSVFWWSRWRCSTKLTRLTTIELNQMKTVAQVLETSVIFTDNTSFWNYPRPTNILTSPKILVLVKREIFQVEIVLRNSFMFKLLSKSCNLSIVLT